MNLIIDTRKRHATLQNMQNRYEDISKVFGMNKSIDPTCPTLKEPDDSDEEAYFEIDREVNHRHYFYDPSDSDNQNVYFKAMLARRVCVKKSVIKNDPTLMLKTLEEPTKLHGFSEHLKKKVYNRKKQPDEISEDKIKKNQGKSSPSKLGTVKFSQGQTQMVANSNRQILSNIEELANEYSPHSRLPESQSNEHQSPKSQLPTIFSPGGDNESKLPFFKRNLDIVNINKMQESNETLPDNNKGFSLSDFSVSNHFIETAEVAPKIKNDSKKITQEENPEIISQEENPEKITQEENPVTTVLCQLKTAIQEEESVKSSLKSDAIKYSFQEENTVKSSLQEEDFIKIIQEEKTIKSSLQGEDSNKVIQEKDSVESSLQKIDSVKITLKEDPVKTFKINKEADTSTEEKVNTISSTFKPMTKVFVDKVQIPIREIKEESSESDNSMEHTKKHIQKNLVASQGIEIWSNQSNNLEGESILATHKGMFQKSQLESGEEEFNNDNYKSDVSSKKYLNKGSCVNNQETSILSNKFLNKKKDSKFLIKPLNEENYFNNKERNSLSNKSINQKNDSTLNNTFNKESFDNNFSPMKYLNQEYHKITSNVLGSNLVIIENNHVSQQSILLSNKFISKEYFNDDHSRMQYLNKEYDTLLEKNNESPKITINVLENKVLNIEDDNQKGILLSNKFISKEHIKGIREAKKIRLKNMMKLDSSPINTLVDAVEKLSQRSMENIPKVKKNKLNVNKKDYIDKTDLDIQSVRIHSTRSVVKGDILNYIPAKDDGQHLDFRQRINNASKKRMSLIFQPKKGKNSIGGSFSSSYDKINKRDSFLAFGKPKFSKKSRFNISSRQVKQTKLKDQESSSFSDADSCDLNKPDDKNMLPTIQKDNIIDRRKSCSNTPITQKSNLNTFTRKTKNLYSRLDPIRKDSIINKESEFDNKVDSSNQVDESNFENDLVFDKRLSKAEDLSLDYINSGMDKVFCNGDKEDALIKNVKIKAALNLNLDTQIYIPINSNTLKSKRFSDIQSNVSPLRTKDKINQAKRFSEFSVDMKETPTNFFKIRNNSKTKKPQKSLQLIPDKKNSNSSRKNILKRPKTVEKTSNKAIKFISKKKEKSEKKENLHISLGTSNKSDINNEDLSYKSFGVHKKLAPMNISLDDSKHQTIKQLLESSLISRRNYRNVRMKAQLTDQIAENYNNKDSQGIQVNFTNSSIRSKNLRIDTDLLSLNREFNKINTQKKEFQDFCYKVNEYNRLNYTKIVNKTYNAGFYKKPVDMKFRKESEPSKSSKGSETLSEACDNTYYIKSKNYMENPFSTNLRQPSIDIESKVSTSRTIRDKKTMKTDSSRYLTKNVFEKLVKNMFEEHLASVDYRYKVRECWDHRLKEYMRKTNEETLRNPSNVVVGYMKYFEPEMHPIIKKELTERIEKHFSDALSYDKGRVEESFASFSPNDLEINDARTMSNINRGNMIYDDSRNPRVIRSFRDNIKMVQTPIGRKYKAANINWTKEKLDIAIKLGFKNRVFEKLDEIPMESRGFLPIRENKDSIMEESRDSPMRENKDSIMKENKDSILREACTVSSNFTKKKQSDEQVPKPVLKPRKSIYDIVKKINSKFTKQTTIKAPACTFNKSSSKNITMANKSSSKDQLGLSFGNVSSTHKSKNPMTYRSKTIGVKETNEDGTELEDALGENDIIEKQKMMGLGIKLFQQAQKKGVPHRKKIYSIISGGSPMIPSISNGTKPSNHNNNLSSSGKLMTAVTDRTNNINIASNLIQNSDNENIRKQLLQKFDVRNNMPETIESPNSSGIKN